MRALRAIGIGVVILAALALLSPEAGAQLNRISGNQIFGGTAKPTAVQTGNGTVGAPAWAFLSDPTSGWYKGGSGEWYYSALGVLKVVMRTGGILLDSGVSVSWNDDLLISRVSAGVAKVTQTTTTPAEWQVSGGNGGFISSVKALTELTTIAAAATTNTAIQIPANAVVLGVSVRVVTVIPTAATFTVTSATPAKTWNTAAVTVAANSTDSGTAPGPTFQTTASAIVITPNLTPGAATGQVRVTIYYYTITPPTS